MCEVKCSVVGMLRGQVCVLGVWRAECICDGSVAVLELGWHLGFRAGQSTKGPSLGGEAVRPER